MPEWTCICFRKQNLPQAWLDPGSLLICYCLQSSPQASIQGSTSFLMAPRTTTPLIIPFQPCQYSILPPLKQAARKLHGGPWNRATCCFDHDLDDLVSVLGPTPQLLSPNLGPLSHHSRRQEVTFLAVPPSNHGFELCLVCRICFV
jgi:hypothetical protein